MNTKTELLPCPFCGSDVGITIDPASDGSVIAQISCTHCECSFTSGDCDIYNAEGYISEQWNTRVYQPEVQAAIKRDTPKKPNTMRSKYSVKPVCPHCDALVYRTKFCQACGQRLDWSEE